MAISAKLELRQGQQLVMTPQLQQAIRLLQLSNLELTAFVDAELERNPLLERDEREPEGADNFDGPDWSNETSAALSSEASDNSDDTNGRDGEPPEAWQDSPWTNREATQALDAEPDVVYPDAAPSDLMSETAAWSTLRDASSVGEFNETSLESFVRGEPTLKDHLLPQLHLVLDTPAELMVGQYLLDLLDDAGYLRADLAEVGQRFNACEQFIGNVVAKLQTCEPAGVFARSLAECLALQLMERNRLDPMMQRFLDHLDLLASHNLAALRRVTGADAEDIGDMIAEIRALDPKPGLKFGQTPLQPLVPDVLVRASKDGGWLIELNSETLPKVLVNRTYYAKVASRARAEGDRAYLTDCLQTANWLVKSLDQRARTILRVSEEIVRQQDRFFAYGIQHLRPLNLRTVAEAIDMHESTVSRVTSNKYMSTPRGIFELKYFFTSGIASAEQGEMHSSEAVRYRIKAMIDAESPETVLSDDKIVEKLKFEGVDIARRTVAKYREAMGIRSSVQRRREKRMALQFEPTRAC